MPDLTTLKQTLRKTAFAVRKTAHAAGPGEASERLLAAVGAAAGRTVAGYMPIRTEIDPLPVMAALVDAGARVCVPVILGEGQALRFRAWTPGCAMEPGAFGAAVPATGDWLVPDTVIVPLVAFDASLGRLGYGGGFYDRTLEGLRASAPTRAIGFAYDAQEMDSLPQEPTDQPLDAVVTPTRVLRAV